MTSEVPLRQSRLRTGFGLMAVVLVTMWAVELIDATLLSDWLETQGIQPREVGGLDGILWAPFLHGSFSHLISNTAPFAVLGGLVAIRGRRRWVTVTLSIVVVAGAATWLLARAGNHIGASGVVFGYLGFLVAAAVRERKLSSVAIGVVAVALYGGLVFGIVPQPAVSWEGHLFGLLAGVFVAFASRVSPN